MRKITLKQALIDQSDRMFYRRQRIIKLHFQGCSNKKIAEKLGYCVSTIEKDLHAVRVFQGRKNFALS